MDDIAVLLTVKARVIILVLSSLLAIAMLGHRGPDRKDIPSSPIPPSA